MEVPGWKLNFCGHKNKHMKTEKLLQRRMLNKTNSTWELYFVCSNIELGFEMSPFLAMRPATVNWLESLAAPLPLFFHCSSLSLRIFILSASDILAPTSTLLFYQEKNSTTVSDEADWEKSAVEGDETHQYKLPVRNLSLSGYRMEWTHF